MKTLTPAYARDYRSAIAVIADYKAGKEFILNDITSRWNGKPCSIRDFPSEHVILRYNRLRNTVVYTGQEDRQ